MYDDCFPKEEEGNNGQNKYLKMQFKKLPWNETWIYIMIWQTLKKHNFGKIIEARRKCD